MGYRKGNFLRLDIIPLLPPPCSGIDEAWRYVSQFPGYAISTHGRLVSCRRAGTAKLFRGPFTGIWRLKATRPNKQGYLRYCLSDGDGAQDRFVSRLVLEAFVGPCPEGMEACHKDNNRLNNRLYNLYWGTHLHNMREQYRHGTRIINPDLGPATFGDADIRRLFERFEQETGQTVAAYRDREFRAKDGVIKTLAREFIMAPMTVIDLVRGRTHKHVPIPEHDLTLVAN